MSRQLDRTNESPGMIYTIGHSTRSFDQLVDILTAHRIGALADVRQHPRSRRFPHFNDESLAIELPKHKLEYLSFKTLGGRRKAARDSINVGWRHESFRGYADFMQTPEFISALDQLMIDAAQHRVAIMCSEAVPWRCHRSLIADALVIRGWEVMHIMSKESAHPHVLTPFARVDGLRLTYPAAAPQLFDQP